MNPERNQLFYIANLSSEISRYLDFVERKDLVESERAWQRVEKIRTLIFELNPTKSSRSEIDSLMSFVKYPRQTSLSIAEIKSQCINYFNPFLLRLMMKI